MGCVFSKPGAGVDAEFRDYDPEHDSEILNLAIVPHYADFVRHNAATFMNLYCQFYNHAMRIDMENAYFNIRETSTKKNIRVPSRVVIEFVDFLMKRDGHKYTISITKEEKGGLMTFAVVQ